MYIPRCSRYIVWVPAIWPPFPGGFRETPRTALSASEILNRETAETNLIRIDWLQSVTTRLNLQCTANAQYQLHIPIWFGDALINKRARPIIMLLPAPNTISPEQMNAGPGWVPGCAPNYALAQSAPLGVQLCVRFCVPKPKWTDPIFEPSSESKFGIRFLRVLWCGQHSRQL